MSGSWLSMPPVQPGDPREVTTWFPSAEALVSRTRGAGVEALAPALIDELGGLGAPGWELWASPLSARVSLLAVDAGLSMHHHELRRRGLYRGDGAADGPGPELEETRDRGDWTDGVLAPEKYVDFTLEEMQACFDPNMRSKWRPHELVHRLLGFFWHPEMSRVEAYIGARIGELLPVVHWYGLDEIWRGRCPVHARRERYRVHCGACEDAARAAAGGPWGGDEADVAGALLFADTAVRHLDEELRACAIELDTGRRVETFRPRLDASSDAMGYLDAHWTRLTSWGMGAWVELFLAEGEDYASSVEALLSRCAALAARVVGGPVVPATGAQARQRRVRRQTRRALQDLGMRTLRWLDGASETDEARVWGPLEALARRAQTLGREEAAADQPEAQAEDQGQIQGQIQTELQAEIQVEVDALRDAIGGPASARVCCVGARTSGVWADALSVDALVCGRVCAGLRSGLPDTVGDWEDAALDSAVIAFMRDPAFDAAGELRVRFARWLRGRDDPRADEVDLEVHVRRRPQRDEEAEAFATIPTWSTVTQAADAQGHGVLRQNSTLRLGTFSTGAARAVLGWTDADVADAAGEGGAVDVAVAWFGATPRAACVDPRVEAALRVALTGDPGAVVEAAGPEVVEALLERGLLVWLPRPTRG